MFSSLWIGVGRMPSRILGKLSSGFMSVSNLLSPAIYTIFLYAGTINIFALFADVRSRYGLSLRCLEMISEKYPASSGISSTLRQTCSPFIPQFSTAAASRLLLVSISLIAFIWPADFIRT